MLGRIWRRLVQWIQKVLGIGSTQSRIQNLETPQDNPPNPLSDAGYEQLWMQALDGVAAGWDREKVLAHFGKRTEDRVLKFWLQRFRQKLLESPVPNKELARRMVLLGGIWTTHPLAQTAAEIGNALLMRELPPLTEAEYDSLFRELLKKTAQGEAAISEFWQEMSARGTEEDWVVWLRGYGKMLLAEAEPNQTVAKALVRLGEMLPESVASLGSVAAEIGAQMREREVIWEIWEYVEEEGHGDGDAEECLKRGVQQYQAGDFEGALESFDRALEIKPDFPNIWFLRGGVLAILKRYEEAVTSYNRVIEIKPDFPEAFKILKMILLNLGRHKDVLASCNRALEIKPDFPEAWTSRGIVLLNLERYEEALVSFDRAIELKADFLKVWTSRNMVLLHLGRHKDALVSCDRAIELKPDYPEAWTSRGIVLESLGRYEEALASFDRAIELKPDFYDAWYNRGIALDRSGRYEEALENFERTIELKLDYPLVWYSRGIVLSNLGRYEDAVATYNRAIEFKPDYPEAWSNRGDALGDLGRHKDALVSCDRAIELKPDYPEAWTSRGIVLESLGRYEEALASFDRAIELKPDLYLAWLNRGITVGNLKASILMPSPLAIQNPQLNQPGYPGKLATYEEGLKHCPRDTHPEGWGLLNYEIGRAHYFRGRVDSRPQPYFRDARTHYLQALNTLTETDFPERHLDVLQDLVKVYRGLRQTEKIEEFQRRGAELLKKLLADPHRSDFQKQKLALKSAAFNQFTVDTLIRQGSLTQALEVAEAGKNACLRWLLYGFEYEPESPDFAQMRDWVQPGTALVSWHLSPVALTAFVLLPSGELAVFPETEDELDSLHRVQQLEDWIARWNREYSEYRGDKDKQENDQKSPANTPANTDWRGEMDNRLAELAQLLHIPEICQHLSSPENSNPAIETLILVPHRDLHRLPLPALFTLANPSQNLAITTLPSIKIGLNLSPREIPPTSELLAIAHPTSSGFAPLPYAVLEVAAIRQFFPHGTSLADANATASHVAQSLETVPPLLHFAGHGTYNFNTPLAAYLALAGEDKLTLKQLLEQPLGDIALVTLAACETAITGNETIASEYVGLVSGFLSRGVPYVISTLWVVESAASALLVAYFYRQLAKGKSPAIALMSAQSWLRGLTAGKLRRLYRVILAKLPEDEFAIEAYLDTECDNLATMNASDRLYDSPYHWAAFTLTGL